MSYSGQPDADVIKSLPPDVLRQLPGAQPPPGVRANFTNPPTRVPVVLGVESTFLFIAVFCYSVRIYTKFAIVKKWKWDDLTITLGFLGSLVHYIVTVNGSVNGATGKHQWDLHLDKLVNDATLYQSIITVLIGTPTLGLIKMSLFIQYYQLFNIVGYIRIALSIGATLTATFYIAVSVTYFALGSSWPGETVLDTILSWHYLKLNDFSIPTGVISTVVDWCLLIFPLLAISQLHLPTKRKLGVAVIFLTGSLATAASMVSLNYRVQIQRDLRDPTWKVSYVLLWSYVPQQVEMFAGITASSMPTVRQFFVRYQSSLKLENSSLGSKIASVKFSSIRTAREKPSSSSAEFRQWGYNSHYQEEDTIALGSPQTTQGTQVDNISHRDYNEDIEMGSKNNIV